ncbi:uncharacterized protein LOC62_02G002610 [Vanrija pseudolonga]|uniref:Uncharacterized protein n=1 Tax=Vanrija pseudolonga TaxID=143232 RepID=A0AAF0Y6M5_9TREE|nr:hypothetical protein LOC62_02G002610 [Vanrija pseudolonga]
MSVPPVREPPLKPTPPEAYGSRGIRGNHGRTLRFSEPPPVIWAKCNLEPGQLTALQAQLAKHHDHVFAHGHGADGDQPNIARFTPDLVALPGFDRFAEHYLAMVMVTVGTWQPTDLVPKAQRKTQAEESLMTKFGRLTATSDLPPHRWITGLTAAFLTMHVWNASAAMHALFTAYPGLIANDVRTASLGQFLGPDRIQWLLRLLLGRLHHRRAYTIDDESLQACGDLLVAYLSREENVPHSPQAQMLTYRIRELFTFVPKVLTWDLQLHAVRVGLMYGALAVSVRLEQDAVVHQNAIIRAGLGAIGGIIGAAWTVNPFAVLRPAAAASAATVTLAYDAINSLLTAEEQRLAQVVAVVVHKFNVQVLRAGQQGVVPCYNPQWIHVMRDHCHGCDGHDADWEAKVDKPVTADEWAAALDAFQSTAATVLQMIVFGSGVPVTVDVRPVTVGGLGQAPQALPPPPSPAPPAHAPLPPAGTDNLGLAVSDGATGGGGGGWGDEKEEKAEVPAHRPQSLQAVAPQAPAAAAAGAVPPAVAPAVAPTSLPRVSAWSLSSASKVSITNGFVDVGYEGV